MEKYVILIKEKGKIYNFGKTNKMTLNQAKKEGFKRYERRFGKKLMNGEMRIYGSSFENGLLKKRWEGKEQQDKKLTKRLK